jgi:ABC-type cobalamin/Fe3+-siderophores transport system ATPase subunit
LFFRALEKARMNREMTIVMVTHDINTALSSCTHVFALLHGGTQYSGVVDKFREQCPKILDTLYGIGFEPYASVNGSAQVYGTWGQQL